MVALDNIKQKTLKKFIEENEFSSFDTEIDFSKIIYELLNTSLMIEAKVRRAGINNILGTTGRINIHGDTVRKIDDYANDIIIKNLSNTGLICAMISEESEELVTLLDKTCRGKYIIAFDPLDGSTNFDVNGTLGTIFSIYKRLDTHSNATITIEDALQPGISQIAAGYIIYSGSTILVFTTGNGVHSFTYDPQSDEFLLTNDNIRIPERGWYYSCNEANYFKWDARVRKFIDDLKNPPTGESCKLRYYATSAADIHRTMLYGGIYLFPAENDKPNGKLRLFYEANPLAMIIEQAGGRASDGRNRILEITPESIHQRTPLFIGSPENVKDIENIKF
ncbi:MAG: Fructose-1,6-bisphosphatase class 1 [Ignavibacteria bacterium]|nr:Fructose-1,6-bisphosphatase class 1 [Ignavibacteria bacterium]